ncbi:helix-turn-helix transcriptional regulator [Shewanella sp. WXL01]|uniref:helix-turn-helix domain-containing protein n=1 Tax=Shewanella sp. WXL01 TaxID=2709721 RepID=UPI0014385C8F|nr:AraC family transcriptional regulator [Shewanella sp. WXL01]NKF52750.1 helix-turn-helix transcriptional regulator [Shewanella sp. WXL01]
MNSDVWFRAGIIIIYGSSIDASPHSHHAIQLAWPRSNCGCTFDNKEINTAVVIDSNTQHQLKMDEGWILLVEPSSELGVALKKKLEGRPSRRFEGSSLSFNHPKNSRDLMEHLSSLFESLGLSTMLALFNQTQTTDPRIRTLLIELSQCLDGQCLKPNHWRASDVAKKLALSESRFLHLFSEELGIPWRPYLLWCRMICAVRAILKGASATDAAYMAGFSDSSHLSRSFRKMFGMTIRQAKSVFQES